MQITIKHRINNVNPIVLIKYDVTNKSIAIKYNTTPFDFDILSMSKNQTLQNWVGDLKTPRTILQGRTCYRYRYRSRGAMRRCTCRRYVPLLSMRQCQSLSELEAAIPHLENAKTNEIRHISKVTGKVLQRGIGINALFVLWRRICKSCDF